MIQDDQDYIAKLTELCERMKAKLKSNQAKNVSFDEGTKSKGDEAYAADDEEPEPGKEEPVRSNKKKIPGAVICGLRAEPWPDGAKACTCLIVDFGNDNASGNDSPVPQRQDEGAKRPHVKKKNAVDTKVDERVNSALTAFQSQSLMAHQNDSAFAPIMGGECVKNCKIVPPKPNGLPQWPSTFLIGEEPSPFTTSLTVSVRKPQIIFTEPETKRNAYCKPYVPSDAVVE